MPRAGEILSAYSRAEVARNPAGAWFGEQVRKPVRAWIANLRYVGTSAMRRRSDYWASLKGNPLHGARSRRGKPTVILAAEPGWRITGTSMVVGAASPFVETCVEQASLGADPGRTRQHRRSSTPDITKPIPRHRDRIRRRHFRQRSRHLRSKQTRLANRRRASGWRISSSSTSRAARNWYAFRSAAL